MTFILNVDAARWRTHLDRELRLSPGLVPVVKGNGYGFGTALLAAECERLRADALDAAAEGGGFDQAATDGGHRRPVPDVDLVSVGTYAEVPDVLVGFGGRVLVLEPFRVAVHGGADQLTDPALVHTVSSRADLIGLAQRAPGAAVVIEGLTSMNRFGAVPAEVRSLLDAVAGGVVDLRLHGVTLHLPLGGGHEGEVRRWIDAFPEQGSWFVSHLSTDESARLRLAYAGKTIRDRVGTRLWLGDPDSWWFTGSVLEAKAVAKGTRAGYRGHRLPAGVLLVVSGGTAHGVAMEAPTAAGSPRQRAVAVAEGVLEAVGRIRSPFTVAGQTAWFVEPPHMQVSLIHLPGAVRLPAIGDELPVRMRATTAYPDVVRFG